MLTDIPTRKLNLATQLGHLRAIFPDSHSRIVEHCELEWSGIIQPSAFSESYLVSLSYRIGSRPAVEVLEPELVVPTPKSEIHMFHDGSLCLHFIDEWRPDIVVAKTVLPWAAEWLLHYELWRVTGQWLGGGIHLGDCNCEKVAAYNK